MPGAEKSSITRAPKQFLILVVQPKGYADARFPLSDGRLQAHDVRVGAPISLGAAPESAVSHAMATQTVTRAAGVWKGSPPPG